MSMNPPCGTLIEGEDPALTMKKELEIDNN